MFSFLSSLFASGPKEPDLSFGLLQKHGVDALIRQQQWTKIEAVAASLSSDELSRLLDGICLTSRYNHEITRFATTSEQEFARLVAGAWYLYQAWEARTGNWAEELGQAEIDGFLHCLQLAKLHLSGTFENPAYHGEAQARLVRVWMGLSEVEEALKSFYQSTAHDQAKWWAHHHMFKLASPKWLGDKEELVAFIESVEDEAIRYALWMMFLVEMYSDYDTEAPHTAQQQWYAEYQPLIQSLLTQPSLPVADTLVSIYANNNLAYVYHLLGEKEKRNQLLVQLAHRLSPYPWAYFGIEAENEQRMKQFRALPALPKPC